jgi:Concanavalin A-like lectin/glucanases superfamily
VEFPRLVNVKGLYFSGQKIVVIRTALGSGPSQLVLQLADNNGFSNYGSTAAVPADGNWHLVAVTVTRNSTGTFYWDGNSIGTFNPTGHTGSLNSPGVPLMIGTQESFQGGGEFFNGGLDELQIFSRALTSAEVLRVFQTGAPGECKP